MSEENAPHNTMQPSHKMLYLTCNIASTLRGTLSMFSEPRDERVTFQRLHGSEFVEILFKLTGDKRIVLTVNNARQMRDYLRQSPAKHEIDYTLPTVLNRDVELVIHWGLNSTYRLVVEQTPWSTVLWDSIDATSPTRIGLDHDDTVKLLAFLDEVTK